MPADYPPPEQPVRLIGRQDAALLEARPLELARVRAWKLHAGKLPDSATPRIPAVDNRTLRTHTAWWGRNPAGGGDGPRADA